MHKKLAKVLPALTMAAVAGLYGKSAQANVVVNQFYSADNGTGSVPQYVLSTTSQFTAGTVSSFTLNATNPVVNMAVGEFFRFGISDSIQNDPNGASGGSWDTAFQGTNAVTQPTQLGIGVVQYGINSSDVNAVMLAGVQKTATNVFHGIQDFNSTGILGAKLTGNNFSSGVADTETGVGTVGINFFMFAGQNPGNVNSTTTAGNSTISFFTASAATLSQATNLFTKLAYKGVAAGTVTLTPIIPPQQLDYWVNTNPGTVTSNGAPASTATYALVTANFSAGHDTLNPLDGVVSANNLIVNITSTGGGSAHPIISIGTTAPASNYGVQLTNAASPGPNQGIFSTGTNKLTVLGSNHSYTPASVTSIDAEATDYVDVNGFTSPDTELYALDIVGTSNIAGLVADINSSSAYGYGSAIASSTSTSSAFGTQYNLFLTFTNQSDDAFLGFDFTQSPDVTGAQVSAIEVIPEPTSLSMLGLGAVGLLARRGKRSKA